LTADELARLRISEHPAPGVNVVGPFAARSGLGEAARLLLSAIEHAGVPFTVVVDPDSPSAGLTSDGRALSNDVPYDVNLLCLQPDRLDGFAAAVDPRFFAGRTTIGFVFWESTVFPDRFRPALRLLDRIWATSEHVRSILAATTAAPVSVVPLPVPDRSVAPVSRGALGLPEDGFLFLSLFDLMSARRKNPEGVVDAYRRAFEPGSGTTLVLKTINGSDRKRRQLAELEQAVAGRDDIVLIDRYVPEAQRDAMISACDCFVSLHRAEGLSLPLLEAARLGKPTIATGFSGNLEFLDDESSYLVPYRLVPVPEGEWAYSPTAQWAEPSVEVAAAFMRRVVDDPDEARAVGATARNAVLTRFSLERSAATVSAELAAARSGFHEGARRREPIVNASLAVARDATRIPYEGGGLKGSFRRLLVRALWPQLEAIRERDQAILEALGEVERSLARLESGAAEVSHNGASGSRRRAPAESWNE
jgi:glycosyltransferase involved in cell wall biosynthesis